MKAVGGGMRSSGAVAVMLAACSCPPVAAQAPGPAVSFAKQVAPILVAKCGGCHVAGRKGGFQMASYAALMETGVVQRGNGNASRLIEVILSGDMPRGGGMVAADEVGMLIKWIDAGAGCDVADPTLPLDQVARIGTAPPPPPRPIVAVPLERGAVSFATDVAPVLLKECVVCHGAEDAEANLRMTSLAALLEGGRGGPTLTAGKGATSLLVRKLRGREIQGQRMPLNAEPLADDVIARIERWIDEGARLDVLAAKTPLETLVAAGRARGMSAADLEQLRFEAGRKLYRRALPDEEPVSRAVEGVCLIGNLPAARIEELAASAGPLARRVGKELVADGAPLLRGGVVVYLFRHSYDYSALWQNVIGVERPKGLTGNAGMAGEVAYGAALLPADDDANRDLLVAEQLAGAALAGRTFPEWFVRGAARAVAMRVVPKAPLVQDWKRDVPAAVAKLGSAADFLAGRSDPVAATTAAGGFLSAVATGARLKQIVAAVDAGGTFDDSFAKVFRATPQAAFEAWAAREAKRGPKPR